MPASISPERFESYYQRRNTTPLVGFMVGSYYPLKRYRGAAGLPNGPFRPSDLDIDAFMPDYDRLHALHARCPGDMVYGASAFWGVPWLEAALGCQVEADHLTGSSRSHIPSGEEWPTIPKFSRQNPWVARNLDMMRAIALQARGRYPMGASLMRGISDLLSALLGLDRTIYGMLDDPAKIDALCEQLVDFWIAFGRAQLEEAVPYQDGYGSFAYYLWAPGHCIWLQEDAAALLSPELYERFILPHDRRIAAAFPYCLMHLHPARYLPYRPLLDSELAVIEIHIDKGGPTARDLLPVYREVLGKKPLLVWGDVTRDDVRTLVDELPPEGLGLQIVVDSPEEAWSIYREFWG